MADFVHLHLHTEYSLLDGACRVEPLARRVAELGQRSLALTDHGVLFAALPFYEACRRQGIKPILGCEVYVAPSSRHQRSERERPYHLTLLAADLAGYHNLIRLSSRGHTEGFHYKPRVDLELLAEHQHGLVVLTGCLSGPLARSLSEGRPEEARRWAELLREIYTPERLYVELQDHGLPQQQELNPKLVELGRALNLAPVATNDVHYLHQSDARLHDLLLCIATGKTVAESDRMRFPCDQFYLKSAAEMARRFGDLPEALANTVAVAEQCSVELSLGRPVLPAFTLPPGYQDADAYLRHLCLERLSWRYPSGVAAEVTARLEHELAVIARMGYAGYFLIVWDFVDYARRQDIPVGPGRGSGAGSLVAYLLGITGIDPLRYGLLFERFLNPERVDMPDFDIDIDHERRSEVIAYVARKYGEGRVAQIITFGTLAARAAVRDVGRALGLPYGEVDRVAKAIPLGFPLDRALAEAPELREAMTDHPRLEELVQLALKVEGAPRHASIHAAGVVIAPGPLDQFVPLYRGAEGSHVTQYTMEHLQALGLLKMDFLGLRTLTVIDRAQRSVRRQFPDFDLDQVPLADGETVQLLAEGQTIGCFQLEAAWVADTLRQMRPERFEDIAAAVALCRPGPMQYIPDYCAAREKGVSYRHPALVPILQETRGIMIYQEQVMRVAEEVAGFSLSEADLLRRAVGKKKPKELAGYRERFLAGARQRGYAGELAEQLFEDILSFAGYGFNKSHAYAYGLLAYQTAYLKRHHPVEFMAALLGSVVGLESKVALYLAECRRLGVTVLHPDVSEPVGGFIPVFENGRPVAIRFGLATVKNVGQGAVEAIAAARVDGGPFISLEDLLQRVDSRYLPRKAVEALIKSGACDAFGEKRPALLERLDRVLEVTQSRHRLARNGQISLFDLDPAATGPTPPGQGRPMPQELTAAERRANLALEREALGFYLSGHPLGGQEERLRLAGCTPVAALAELPDGSRVTIGGILTAARRTTTRSGGAMAFLALEDPTGSTEVVVFPRVYTRCRQVLTTAESLLVRGRVQVEDGEAKVLADEVAPLETPAPFRAGSPLSPEVGESVVYLRVTATDPTEPPITEIRRLLGRYPGASRVRIKLEPSGRWIEVTDRYRVQVTPDLMEALRRLLGPGAVVVRGSRP